ncbi:electron transfer flavoprotein subunit beta/FixA family protein [uncultured Veillonella sp.]|uniref:electron transfer flavoprotein subunit beta/FixA family protein n=1 Tax=uncultured Veillonella sp. TaxID=159268 RepID=UPI0025D28166|nr:electron transfer flavoprotein subunit beta/FixA family protein [uncultured Veillonella sp.]MDY3973719.1 electron transfer flavoprotein subunit beta/FixA family protein [Veillonella caviae]
MELLVCIKQVPDTSEIKLDPETNTLIRTGLPSIVNPFDMNALEAALKVKDANPGTRVTVITMGPPQADVALRECISMGADEAYLITDRAFAGADTLATSYTIAKAIEKVQEIQGKPFDIIFCGKQAIDGDTAQVGPQIAEEMGIPQVTYVCELNILGDGVVRTHREHEEGFEVLDTDMPVLVTAVKSLNEPRYPTLLNSIRAFEYEIHRITVNDMTTDPARLGLKGSPTRVRKVYSPPMRSAGTMLTNGTAESVATIVDVLTKRELL